MGGLLASQHIVDVVEPAEIDVGRAPNESPGGQSRREGQVNHFALEIDEAAQRGVPVVMLPPRMLSKIRP